MEDGYTVVFTRSDSSIKLYLKACNAYVDKNKSPIKLGDKLELIATNDVVYLDDRYMPTSKLNVVAAGVAEYPDINSGTCSLWVYSVDDSYKKVFCIHPWYPQNAEIVKEGS